MWGSRSYPVEERLAAIPGELTNPLNSLDADDIGLVPAWIGNGVSSILGEDNPVKVVHLGLKKGVHVRP